MTALTRFWSKVRKTDGCWLWTGTTIRGGYGMIRFPVRDSITAHRASWLIHRGEIPDGLFVLHKCDNPPCVNPEHLFLGTHQDNMRDMVAKGRHFAHVRPWAVSRGPRPHGQYRKGESVAGAVLTEGQVREIRALWETGAWQQRQIARQYGVNFRTVHYIVHRKLWKHI